MRMQYGKTLAELKSILHYPAECNKWFIVRLYNDPVLALLSVVYDLISHLLPTNHKL